MEPMKPVDVGRQVEPLPRWRRWGWWACGAIAFVVAIVLSATISPPIWVTIGICLAIGVIWSVVELAVARRTQR